jgi:hypothetical protein
LLVVVVLLLVGAVVAIFGLSGLPLGIPAVLASAAGVAIVGGLLRKTL